MSDTEEIEPTKEAVVPQPDPAQETDWKAEARKWEKLAKSNKDAAARLVEIEDASKSELEKVTDRAQQAEARAAELEAAAQVASWKAEVSKSAGVPAEVLAGSNLEEIEAHAAALQSLVAKPDETPPGKVGPYVPAEGTGAGTATSTADMFADAVRPFIS